MAENKTNEYDRLEVGQEFPAVAKRLDRSMVNRFLSAVEEIDPVYDDDLVPPMAIAAQAMSALSECVTVPPGSIHVTQELEFQGLVRVGETVSCRAGVLRKQERGRLRIITVGIEVDNPAGEIVMTGKTSFMLPVQE